MLRVLALLVLVAVLVGAGYGPSVDNLKGGSVQPQVWVIWGAKNATAVTGALKGPGNADFDTTTGTQVGWHVPQAMTIQRIWTQADAGSAPNCTTQIYVDQTLAYQSAWGGNQNDSTGVGLSVAAGEVVTFWIKAKAVGGVEPDHPMIWAALTAD